MIKNYTNLIYANQLKTRISRSIISVIRNKTHDGIRKAQETMPWMYHLPQMMLFEKKEPPIFIYKGMKLSLKLLPLSSS